MGFLGYRSAGMLRTQADVDALLKAYVWNKNGISFELKNLKIK